MSTLVMRIRERRSLLLFASGWLVTVTALDVAAQAPAEPKVVAPAEPSQPAAAPSTAELVSERAKALAQLLKPEQYGPAFYSGAQAELVVPDAGVSSFLLGYDAVWMQTDLSLGLGVGGDPVENLDTTDAYIVSVRFAFPVHRGIRADYALMVGGGATLFDPTEGSTFVTGSVFAGAKFRVFMTPNVAVGATLGLAAFIRGEHSSFVAGARPLGAASVVYFFR